jgi:hypothetical protein
VGGVPVPREDHAEIVADFALDILTCVKGYNLKHGKNLAVRIGIQR